MSLALQAPLTPQPEFNLSLGFRYAASNNPGPLFSQVASFTPARHSIVPGRVAEVYESRLLEAGVALIKRATIGRIVGGPTGRVGRVDLEPDGTELAADAVLLCLGDGPGLPADDALAVAAATGEPPPRITCSAKMLQGAINFEFNGLAIGRPVCVGGFDPAGLALWIAGGRLEGVFVESLPEGDLGLARRLAAARPRLPPD